jgi:integrase
VPEAPVPLLSADQLRALLKACEGRGYPERRDAAIIRLFVDTGMRLSELTNLTVDDVDFTDSVAFVLGTGHRQEHRWQGDDGAKNHTKAVRWTITCPDEKGRNP